MDPQTNKVIIIETSSTSTKTIEHAVRDSLKTALPQEFLDKTRKRIESSTIREFKSKGNKIRYEANSNILEKMDDAINAIKKAHTSRCQEKLKEGKDRILK